MPSILVVASHRPGRNPSQRYRIEQFVPYWELHGVRVEYAWLIDQEDDAVFYTQGRLLDKARIFLKDVIPFVERLGPGAYDIAYCDPPYGSKKLDRASAVRISRRNFLMSCKD